MFWLKYFTTLFQYRIISREIKNNNLGVSLNTEFCNIISFWSSISLLREVYHFEVHYRIHLLVRLLWFVHYVVVYVRVYVSVENDGFYHGYRRARGRARGRARVCFPLNRAGLLPLVRPLPFDSSMASPLH